MRTSLLACDNWDLFNKVFVAQIGLLMANRGTKITLPLFHKLNTKDTCKYNLHTTWEVISEENRKL